MGYPAYMPNDVDSSGGYIANVTRNNVGMMPQIDVAEFVADEALAPKLGHVVALSEAIVNINITC